MVAAAAAFMPVLLICTAGVFFSALINGDDLINDFSDIEAPTGFLSFLDFLKDVALALGSFVVSIITFDVGLPSAIRWPLVVICDTVLLLGIVSILGSVF